MRFTRFSAYIKSIKIQLIPDDVHLDELFAATTNYNEIVSEVSKLELKHPDKPDATEQLFAVSSHATEQLLLFSKYNNPDSKMYRNKLMVFTEYPDVYISHIDRVMHGKWYAACFLENYCNPTVWSHYGDAHKGICLKFRTSLSDNLPKIKLHRIVGIKNQNGKTDFAYGDKTLQFYKVHYAKRYPEIDFFRSLGPVFS